MAYCTGLGVQRNKTRKLTRRVFELEKKINDLKPENQPGFISFRHRLLFHMRKGLFPYNREHTLQQCSIHFKVTAERVRQVVNKMERRLRHPARKNDPINVLLNEKKAMKKNNEQTR